MVNRFYEQRVKRNISTEKLAELSGIPENEIILIESSGYDVEKMPAIKAAHIAEALGCLIVDLIYE